jgi:hypothetical protein
MVRCKKNDWRNCSSLDFFILGNKTKIKIIYKINENKINMPKIKYAW